MFTCTASCPYAPRRPVPIGFPCANHVPGSPGSAVQSVLRSLLGYMGAEVHALALGPHSEYDTHLKVRGGWARLSWGPARSWWPPSCAGWRAGFPQAQNLWGTLGVGTRSFLDHPLPLFCPAGSPILAAARRSSGAGPPHRRCWVLAADRCCGGGDVRTHRGHGPGGGAAAVAAAGRHRLAAGAGAAAAAVAAGSRPGQLRGLQARWAPRCGAGPAGGEQGHMLMWQWRERVD